MNDVVVLYYLALFFDQNLFMSSTRPRCLYFTDFKS